MASVPVVAEGCAKILVPLLCFLGGPSPRNAATDRAVASLLVVLPTAYLAGTIVNRFASIVLACLHLPAPAPAPARAAASSVCLGQFVCPFFALVFAWLLVLAAQLAAFYFLGAGRPGTGTGYVQLEVV
ncbi:hypothetical protein ACUV84_021003 [Puccinellia chinampoensis]